MNEPQGLIGYYLYRTAVAAVCLVGLPFLWFFSTLLSIAGLHLRVGNSFLQAPAHGAGFSGNNPRLAVVHSLECDANEGLAVGLNSGPGSYMWNEGVSPHFSADPGTIRGNCDTDIVGYHVGNGNQRALGGEVTGRASWPTNVWLSGNPRRAIERQAIGIAALCHAMNFAPGDVRWLSLTEVADGHTKGVCTHNDISIAPWGFNIGTNHWDPGPGFPYKVFMTLVRYYFGCLDFWGEDVPDHNVPSEFGSGGGGAQADWFDSVSADVYARTIAEAVR